MRNMHEQSFDLIETMSTEPHDPLAAPEQDSEADLRRIIAIGAIGLAGIATAHETTAATAIEKAPTPIESVSESPHTIESHTRKPRLRNPNTLPGKNIKAGPEVHRKIERSTVQLVRKLKNSDDDWSTNWQGSCTGTKVQINGNSNRVLSAAHCFREDIGAPNGTLLTQNKNDGYADYNEHSQYVYGIATADMNGIIDTQNPVALVTNILVKHNGKFNIDGDDRVVLGVTSMENNGQGKSWNKVPAVGEKHFNGKLIRGQEVALSSIPGAHGYITTGSGIYLGEIGTYTNDVYQTVSVVGIRDEDVSPKEVDACDFGGSGSSFAAKVQLKGSPKKTKIFVSGPLALRINTTYDVDRGHYDSVNPSSTKEQRRAAIELRNMWQSSLGVRTGEFLALCGFTNNDINLRSYLRGMNKKPPHIMKGGVVSEGK